MILFYIFITLATIIIMEGLAWVIHKYLLHGPLWFLHQSHHVPQKTWWEWNDLVSVSYAVAAFFLIFFGAPTLEWYTFVGVGITLYGFLYFYLHDIIIHRRVKIKYNFNSKYIKRLIRAHKKHHKHLGKNPSEAYGFLYATPKYEVKEVQK